MVHSECHPHLKFDAFKGVLAMGFEMKFNALVPELEVSNIRKSLHFYVDILEFKVEFDRPASKFVYFSYYDSQMMICEMKKDGEWQTGSMDYPLGRGMHLQIEVPAIAPLLGRLKNNGVSIFKGPYESWYPVKDRLEGAREFLVQDPDGYLLRFQEDMGSKANTEGLTKSTRIEL